MHPLRKGLSLFLRQGRKAREGMRSRLRDHRKKNVEPEKKHGGASPAHTPALAPSGWCEQGKREQGIRDFL